MIDKKPIKDLFSFCKRSLKEFYNLLIFIFSNRMRRKDFFISFMADTVGVTCLCFSGFLMIMVAAAYLPMFFILVILAALSATFKSFSEQQNIVEEIEQLKIMIKEIKEKEE